jgi:hypothetical protein
MSEVHETFTGLKPMPIIKVPANESIIVQTLHANITTKFTNYHELKYATWFLEYVMTVIENLIKKKLKVDKFEIVQQLLIKLFGISDTEKIILKQNVDHLLKKKIIKKVKISKRVIKFLKKQLPQI